VESTRHKSETCSSTGEPHHEGNGDVVTFVECPGENRDSSSFSNGAQEQWQEGLSGIKVTNYHRKVDANCWLSWKFWAEAAESLTSYAGCVIEKLKPSITVLIPLHFNEIEVNEVEDGSYR